MSYQPFYTITDYKDLPSQDTPLNRRNLLNSERGIKEADNRIVHLDNQKANYSDINTMVSGVSLDADAGVLTVTLRNGAVTTYDLDIEKVVLNFDITDDNKLVLTLADGTVKKIDLTRFVYDVASTATVSMEIKNRVMTATIVDGSVTMKKLDASIQLEFRQYMLDAQSARDEARQYQSFAKRYTLGDEENFPGSETDNAKWYCNEAEKQAQIAQEIADLVYPDTYINVSTGHLISENGRNFVLTLDGGGHLHSAIGR